ncbi:hypothetical protein GGQ54_003164 [Naumannella cuiyingiana]|uniref:Uncharacterized protein n=1 Tax=Naumannella cuiyingiana TaxID=1347891 RepID=A0A7Z0IMC6_9ACTN|nr:hypothetical protein [Naumannella cuiyingiana]
MIATTEARRSAGVASRSAVLINELAKLRHLRIGMLAAVLVVAQAGVVMLTTVSSAEFTDPATRDWTVVLAGLSRSAPLLCPLLIAVIASRLIDIEHRGNGWLMNQTSGTAPGALCRAKLIIGASILTCVAIATNLAILGLGRLAGIRTAVPAGLWAGYAACALLINIVVLAGHLLLAAKIGNQLVTLGIGLVGTVIGVFATGLPVWFAHATPWGYYSLAEAARYQDGHLIIRTPDYLGVLVMFVVAAALFGLLTNAFDRREG